MRTTIGTIFTLCALLAGCDPSIDDENDDINTTNDSIRTSETYAVVIGMEKSKFAGDCPGAKLDSNRMHTLISKYAKQTVLLQDANATRANVHTAIETAIAKSASGLCIISYSGHGGSYPFYDTGMDEADKSDEYLCLYDTFMRDNEIWSLISKSKGRVFLCIDACHSQTMYRQPYFGLKPPLSFDHKLNESQPFSMLCWSGCPDTDYSYGSSSGGQFTNTLLKYFTPTITYQELWNKIKADKALKEYEAPQSTVLGSGFDGKMMLR